MQLVELDGLGKQEWDQLVAGEHEPFGGIGERLEWRAKTHHLGVREDDGRLVAAGGLVLATVQVGEGSPFEVAGLGGVIVTHHARGRGLARLLVPRLLEAAGELDAGRAMLFCRSPLMLLYGRFGFSPIESPVFADQPAGRIEMPLSAMWKGLRDRLTWPPGRVELRGEPF